jgi:hypothetical protein
MKPENPPLFEQSDFFRDHITYLSNVTLRDLFAGLALTTINGDEKLKAFMAMAQRESTDPSDLMAEYAYELADAMLRQRGK